MENNVLKYFWTLTMLLSKISINMTKNKNSLGEKKNYFNLIRYVYNGSRDKIKI